MKYNIKTYMSYAGIALALLSLVLGLNKYFIIIGITVFLVFRFGKYISEVVFTLLGLFLCYLYWYKPELFHWYYVFILIIITSVLYFLGRSNSEKSKKNILGDNKERFCPKCIGTGKDVIYSDTGEPIEIICNICQGTGKFT